MLLVTTHDDTLQVITGRNCVAATLSFPHPFRVREFRLSSCGRYAFVLTADSMVRVYDLFEKTSTPVQGA